MEEKEDVTMFMNVLKNYLKMPEITETITVIAVVHAAAENVKNNATELTVAFFILI